MTAALDVALPARLAASGRSVPMPASNAEIISLLLHLDDSTRARSLVVQFPPGFARLEAGRYAVGEEFLVLTGALELDGRTLESGDWCWVPPGALRAGFGSKRGAVVYAWFSGRNEFVPAPGEPAPMPSSIRSRRIVDRNAGLVLRTGTGHSAPGRSAVLVAGEQIMGPAEALDLGTAVWSRLKHAEWARVGSAGALVRWDPT